MFDQVAFAVWTAFTLLQLPLLVWVWSAELTGSERPQALCYSVALPCCLLPIVNWLLLMFAIKTTQSTGYLPNDIGIGMMIVLLMFLTMTSVVVLPLTFVLFFGVCRDITFCALRSVAFVNLVASLVFGVAALEGGF